MGLEQQDKENESFIFIKLIAKSIKSTPPKRFIFEKYSIDQRGSEEIQVSSEEEMETFRSRSAKLDFVP